jgi:hypothetical protein
MRLAAAAILGLSVVGSAATAATSTDPQVWQGQAFITGFTTSAAKSTCTAGNAASVGDYYLVVYRPIIAGSPNNGVTNDEGLSFFGTRNAVHYYTDDGVSLATPGNAYVIYLNSHAGSSEQNTSPAAVPFNLKITKGITLKTQSITISGSLNDWEDASGCDITFSAALALRVD